MASSSSSFSSLALFFITLLAILAASSNNPVHAEEFNVGDAVGWRVPAVNETELYNVWASRRRFHVGDSLSFRYKANDSVMVVEKWGYYHCDPSNAVSVYNGGEAVISLEYPGPMYFISGNNDHCKEGQRMIVNVMALDPISPQFPPWTIATPPDARDQPYFRMSPSPSPLLSRSSEASGNTAATVVSVSIMALVFSLV